MVDTTLKALTVFKDEVEKYSLRFVKGTVRPDSGQEVVLPKMATAVRQLVDAASAVHYSVQIEVLGHTDKTGSVEENLRLAPGRAEYVIAGLRSQGLTEINLTAVGAGWRQPVQGEMTEEDRALNRRTSLKVILTDPLEEGGEDLFFRFKKKFAWLGRLRWGKRVWWHVLLRVFFRRNTTPLWA